MRREIYLAPWQQICLALVRILSGALMTYHGLEVFDAGKIAEYASWDQLRSLPTPLFAAYLGKGLELLIGICLILGIFTRAAGILLAILMFFICFKIGTGKFWMDDQHPFLFGLIGVIFFLLGPVTWNLDDLLFKNNR